MSEDHWRTTTLTHTDDSQPPLVMIVNSSDLWNTDFNLREVILLRLEVVSRGGQCTCGTTLKEYKEFQDKLRPGGSL